jgi:tetratricopeptide (TPR) repeat protein
MRILANCYLAIENYKLAIQILNNALSVTKDDSSSWNLIYQDLLYMEAKRDYEALFRSSLSNSDKRRLV